ncbi:hypothetical protein KIPB_006529 [Kipferlia bialata]|uniref:Uncharacterized protein n=1 Tax=Kipferlia bialata TaxID=797122 RepID=A0A9K3GJB5_9EUKA|nr:hypothetical protein KIPB_006529 [Kipferlia bialata]|eukprot:g6529.t1
MFYDDYDHSDTATCSAGGGGGGVMGGGGSVPLLRRHTLGVSCGFIWLIVGVLCLFGWVIWDMGSLIWGSDGRDVSVMCGSQAVVALGDMGSHWLQVGSGPGGGSGIIGLFSETHPLPGVNKPSQSYHHNPPKYSLFRESRVKFGPAWVPPGGTVHVSMNMYEDTMVFSLIRGVENEYDWYLGKPFDAVCTSTNQKSVYSDFSNPAVNTSGWASIAQTPYYNVVDNPGTEYHDTGSLFSDLEWSSPVYNISGGYVVGAGDTFSVGKYQYALIDARCTNDESDYFSVYLKRPTYISVTCLVGIVLSMVALVAVIILVWIRILAGPLSQQPVIDNGTDGGNETRGLLHVDAKRKVDVEPHAVTEGEVPTPNSAPEPEQQLRKSAVPECYQGGNHPF